MLLGRGLHMVEIFRIPRCEGLMSPNGGDLQVVTRWRSSDRHRVEVSRTQQDEGLEVATKRRCPGGHREETFKSPKDGNLQVATRWRSPVSFIQPETQARTRCSAYTPSLGFRVGRRMSGIEILTAEEICTKHNSLVKKPKELLRYLQKQQTHRFQ